MIHTSHFTLHPSDDSNLMLREEIVRRIAESQQHRMTFAQFMDLVLYHPQHGYYATKALNLGSGGDFFTSIHLGADFGELLAEQFVQMWELLGKPVPFSLVEMGAGQGILALDILKYLQHHYCDFFAALNYIIVEKSPALIQEQQQRLQEFSNIPLPPDSQAQLGNEAASLLVRWCSLEEIPHRSITGCFFSNELVDALPIHQFVIQQRQLQEVYVTTSGEWVETLHATSEQAQLHATSVLASNEKNFATLSNPNNSFIEVTDELSTPRLAEYFDLIEIELPSSIYPEGYRSEVNLAALDWLQSVAERLQRGYVLTIDYGYPATRYYNPMRSQGTLQCYYQHQRHNNPYINIGRQDITAHVDFTALERWGDRCGLHKVGFTQQGLFLMALGMGDRVAALSTTNQPLQQLLQRRDAFQQLLDPTGLGGFGVLVQSKGLTEAETAQPLKGLSLPTS